MARVNLFTSIGYHVPMTDPMTDEPIVRSIKFRGVDMHIFAVQTVHVAPAQDIELPDEVAVAAHKAGSAEMLDLDVLGQEAEKRAKRRRPKVIKPVEPNDPDDEDEDEAVA